MEYAIKAQKRKYQATFGNEKKRYEEIMMEKQEITESLEAKEKEAVEKKQLIDELKLKYEKYKNEASFNNFVKPESEEQSKKDETNSKVKKSR